jgi:hypothetical protein
MIVNPPFGGLKVFYKKNTTENRKSAVKNAFFFNYFYFSSKELDFFQQVMEKSVK